MNAKQVELRDANAFVEKHHRHHKPVRGHRYSIGAELNGALVGVIIVGRPVARMIDHKTTVEVLRCCTDGARNACSFLYSAAARVAKELGYEEIITYTLESEDGSSLKAAGWELDCPSTGGGDWNRPGRRGRRTDQPMVKKKRWIKYLRPIGRCEQCNQPISTMSRTCLGGCK